MTRNITRVKRIRWRRHATAEALARCWFRGLARAAGVEASGFGENVAAFMRIVREQGAWAFATPHNRTVHYWFEGSLPFLQLVHMLGHEVGHVVGRRGNWLGTLGAPREEKTADLYGAVAALAVREATSQWRPP